jgi:Protein of unknown function (DUF2934)
MIIDRNIAMQPAMDIQDTRSSSDSMKEQEPREATPVDDIATRAYFYWQERGSPEGSPDEDWFRAENELGS